MNVYIREADEVVDDDADEEEKTFSSFFFKRPGHFLSLTAR